MKMPSRSSIVTVQRSPLREYFSAKNIKSMLHGFVYEYETPKIVTIHSVSIAVMCRLIQLLILIYGIVYLMIHKKGYQETDTSIISSITLKVKGIGYNQTGHNQTLVIDGADYIVPPQENNALFLMTNFIRTDQEHKRCPESPNEKKSACKDNYDCEKNKNFQKANGKWTGQCLFKNDTLLKISQPSMGRCELEGWCPVEDDKDIPNPIRDALNFTIFVKNFIEFPRFKVIRKNIQDNRTYLKDCKFDHINHRTCPIFRVGTLLDLVEPDAEEQAEMLRLGGVIRVKIDWNCNLDRSLNLCKPEYSFRRLDTRFKEENFSQGFNFRFASHWKHQNRSYRTLTKAYGLRFIISVSGHAGRFDVITLTLNIGSLIGILGLATFICDIVALYVHRQSDVYRQQKFQDVDLSSLPLDNLRDSTSNSSKTQMKKQLNNHIEPASTNCHTIENNDALSNLETPNRDEHPRDNINHHDLYDNLSAISKDTNQQSTPIFIYGNYHQKKLGLNSSTDSPSLSSVKQRRTTSTRPSFPTNLLNEESQLYDKANIFFVDEDTPELNDSNSTKDDIEEKGLLNNSSSHTGDQSHMLSRTGGTTL